MDAQDEGIDGSLDLGREADDPLIELADVTKAYGEGARRVPVLYGVSLSIRTGDFVAIIGASGSGKSTLMNILGCLDRPSGGTHRFAGARTWRCSVLSSAPRCDAGPPASSSSSTT